MKQISLFGEPITLPPPPLEVHQLGSGSRGNASVVVGPEGALLIDSGFPLRTLAARAEGSGLDLSVIRAIVVTHAHRDHAGGVGVAARKLGVPVWATAATLRRLPDLAGREALRPLPRRGTQIIAGLAVETCPVVHDAVGTVILKVAGRLGIATDFGTASAEVRDFLSGLDGLMLEFNHDCTMLIEGAYAPKLKERILADYGHLSNDQAAALLGAPLFLPPRQVLWLCHLSQDNNRPALARAAAERALGATGVQIVVTSQDEAAPVVTLVG